MQINLSRTVAAPQRAAFAVVADVPHWPEILRSVIEVELLDSGMVRRGTRLREVRLLLGQAVSLEAEIVAFEPPRELRLAVEHRGMSWEFDHVVDAVVGGGSRLTLIFRSTAEGGIGRSLQPLMSPMMQTIMRDELEQDLADLADAVKARASAA
jgi:hypothetical protein